MGLTGDPVPPRIFNGFTVNINSQQFLSAHASAKGFKKALSKRGNPI